MKALFVGLGGIGQRHVRNLRAVLGDRVEILAYRVRRLGHTLTDKLDIQAGVDVEKKYDIRVHDSLDAALEQQPDVAFICNPTSLHIPVARRACQAGCHLFLEKPVADNLEGVGELVEEVEKRRLVTYVGYHYRFHPCLRALSSLLQRGVIGSVLAVRAEVGEYLPGWHPYEDYRQSYAARKDLGGGVILSQIHDLDYLYWLFGFPRRVYAVGGHLSNLEVDVEDVASILMELPVDGRIIPVHLHQDYLQRPPSRTCQVIGDKGKILVDLRGLRLSLYDEQGRLADTQEFGGFERNLLFLKEMEHFLACVAGEESSMVPIRDGVQSLRMALAARESMATGRVVTLN
jgi:predicted dehydrogenase